jgi:glycosyltransferase involved in cell wall biosynthesis
MESDVHSRKAPYFSVCIPQHNRTDFLLKVCDSLAEQTFRDFEVCISDDCSTDGRKQELLDHLERLGIRSRYLWQETNLRYDGNLRAAIGLATGKYCLLLGNDDALATPGTLARLHRAIEEAGEVGVVITNFEDYETGRNTNRIKETGLVGSGPAVAAASFRNFAFVSGVVIDRQRAQHHATTRWDGSEMYQMYIGCRIIAEGGPLLGLDWSAVRKDVRVEGVEVDSYAQRPRLRPCPIQERKLTLVELGRLVVDAIAPYLPERDLGRVAERVLFQIFVFTYPFWLLEYRRVQSWRYALGIALGMRPRNTLEGVPVAGARRVRLGAVFGLTSLIALATPARVFDALQPVLYRVAKSYRARDAQRSRGLQVAP